MARVTKSQLNNSLAYLNQVALDHGISEPFQILRQNGYTRLVQASGPHGGVRTLNVETVNPRETLTAIQAMREILHLVDIAKS